MDIRFEETLPDNIPDWCDVFNSPEFYKIHKTNSTIYISITYKNKLVGVCHFIEIEKGILRSPYRGTYGGLSLNKELSFQNIYDIISHLLKYFKEKKIRSVEIVTEPFSHNLHKSSIILNVFLEKGFSILNHEINHSIIMDEEPLVNKMMRNNKKRFNKCFKEDFQFDEVFTQFDIRNNYKLIKENRESNGHKISMSFDQIMEMNSTFPDNLHFFNVSHNNKLVAASICLKINKDVLYVFYWADKSGYESYSPVVFLASGIYDFAKKSNFKILDVGTSSLNGIPNLGLIAFKENLGFKISPKLTLKLNK